MTGDTFTCTFTAHESQSGEVVVTPENGDVKGESASAGTLNVEQPSEPEEPGGCGSLQESLEMSLEILGSLGCTDDGGSGGSLGPAGSLVIAGSGAHIGWGS